MDLGQKQPLRIRGSLRDVMANVLDCDMVDRKFELQSHYYVHFQTNTLVKGMNSFIPTNNELTSSPAVLLQGQVKILNNPQILICH